MGKTDELGFLKADLENFIQGMTIQYSLLSDDDREILALLTRCKSVIDRIKPIKEAEDGNDSK